MAIRLPSIEQDIDIDTASLAAAIAKAEAFGKAMDQALKVDDAKFRRSTQNIKQDLDGVGDSAERAGHGVDTLGDSVTGLSTKLSSARSGLTNFRQDLTNIARSTELAAKNLNGMVQNIQKLNDAVRTGNTALKNYSDNIGALTRNSEQSNDAMGALRRNIQETAESAQRGDASLRGYNERLGELGRNTRDAQSGRLDEDIDEVGNASRRSDQAINHLADEVDRLALILREAGSSVESFGRKLNDIDAGDNAAEIEALREELDQLRDDAAGAGAGAEVAANRIKKVGREAEDAAFDVEKLAGAFALLNSAMATSTIISTGLKIGTAFAAITGAIGIVGAAIAQFSAAAIGLGAIAGSVGSLAAVIPSAIVGVGLLGATLKFALSDKGTGAAADALKEAKKQLTSLGDEIRTTVQNKTTPAFAELFGSLTKMTPLITQGFGQMADVVANFTSGIAKLLLTDTFQSSFTKLFASAATQAQYYVNVAQEGIEGITALSVAGIPIAEKFALKLNDIAFKFRALTERRNASGELTRSLEDAYQTAGRVAGVIADIGRGFLDLGHLSGSVGLKDSVLQSFERGASGIRHFAQTYRESLTETFRQSASSFDSLGRLVSQIGRTLFLDLGKINITPLLDSLSPLVDLIGKLAIPTGNSLAKGLTGIITAITDARGPLQNVAEIFSTILDTIGEFGTSLIPQITGPLQQVAVEVASFARTISRALTDIIPDLAGPFEKVVTSTRNMMDSIVDAVAPIISILAEPVGDALVLIQDGIANTVDSISGPLASTVKQVLPALSDAFKDVVPAIGDLIVSIANLVSAFGDSFGGAITGAITVITPIIDFFASVATAAQGLPDVLKGVVTGLLAFKLLSGIFGPLAAGIGSFGSSVVNMARGVAASGAAGAVSGLGSAAGGLIRFLGGPWGAVLAGAAIAMVLFGQSSQDAKQAAAEQEAVLSALRDTLDQVTGSVTALTLKKIGKDFVDAGLTDDLDKLGTNVGAAALAVSKGGESFKSFRDNAVQNFTDVLESSEGWRKEIEKGNSTLPGLLKKYSTEANVTVKDIATAWASGGDAYAALIQRTANMTGESVDSVSNGFERIRTVANDATGGLASGLTAIGDEFGNLGTAAEQVQTAFSNLSSSAGEALRGVEGFSNVTDQSLLTALNSAYSQGIPVSEALAKIGVTGTGAATVIAVLGDAIDGSTGKLTGFGNEATKIHDALIKVQEVTNEGIPGASALADAFATLGDQASTAADKTRALKDAMDIMNGKTKELKTAQFDWADSLRDVGDKVKDLTGANAGFIQGINDSNGALDVNNAQHNEFRRTLEGLSQDYDAVNASTYEQVKAQSGTKAALDAATASAQQQRDAFVANLTQMGFSKTAAENLADAYGLIPEDVRTSLSMDGTDKLVQEQIAGVVASLSNIPEGRVIVDNKDGSMDAAIQKMKDLGYSITTLPNGQVMITDNTGPVATNVKQLMEQVAAGGTGTITINSKDTTDEGQKRLKELGYTVETLPDGTIKITDNTPETKQNVQSVVEKLAAVPKDTPVTVTALTAEAEGLLQSLGYTVTHMPDGSTTITAHASTGAAEGALNYAARNRTATITVYTNTGNTGLRAFEAEGGIVSAFAKGGVAKPKYLANAVGRMINTNSLYERAKRSPMSSNIAQIVPANTPRIIGDNITRREGFIPIDRSSARSRAILQNVAYEMGFDLLDRQRKRAQEFALGGIGYSKAQMAMSNAAMASEISRRAIGGAAGIVNLQALGAAIGQQSTAIRNLAQAQASAPQTVPVQDKKVEFNFTTYNPQAVPESEMINRSLQLAAATGLLGSDY